MSRHKRALILWPAAFLAAGIIVLSASSFAGGTATWRSIGPYRFTATAMAVDPANPSTIYAGIGGKGLFKSTDGASSWSMVLANGPDIWTIAIDPVHPDTLYIGSSPSRKSTDGGLTWSALPLAWASKIVIHPRNSTVLYAVDGDHVLKSANGGTEWSILFTAGTSGHDSDAVNDLILDPFDPDTFYFSTDFGKIWKSTDAGASLQELPGQVFANSLAADPVRRGTIYGASRIISKSTDGGQTWTTFDIGAHAAELLLTADTPNSALIYAVTLDRGILKSPDGGATWVAASGGLPDLPVTAVAVDPVHPAVLYAGLIGESLYKSMDGGAHWAVSADGIAASGVRLDTCVVAPSDQNVLYIGGYRSLDKSLDRGKTWISIWPSGPASHSEFYNLAVDPTNPQIVYAAYFGGILKSVNGGTSWSVIKNAPPYDYFHSIAIDPQDPRIIFVGEKGIYQSTDGGATWSSSVLSVSGKTIQVINAIVIDPSNPRVLYATATLQSGTSYDFGVVLKSTNRGDSWQACPGIDRVSHLAVDPLNPSTIYAGGEAGLKKSTDGGASWSDARAGIPAAILNPITSLAVDPKTPGVLYAGTNRTGIFKSTNGGASWTDFNGGSSSLSDNAINEIAVDPIDPAIVYLATWNAGAFTTRANLPWLSMNRSRLDFSALVGTGQKQTDHIILSGSGGEQVFWTAAANQSWIAVRPASGATPVFLTVTVDPAGLAAGSHFGTVILSDPLATYPPLVLTVVLHIYTTGTTSPPFGCFDTPLNGAIVSGSVPVSGWALDDIYVANVKIFRDPVAGEGSGLRYIGEAVFIDGARPDVETAYPGYPLNSRAGWGYMLLTNMLPNGGNGTFVLHALATDVEGNGLEIGTKTIIVNNAQAVKPFGTIDTPMQGGTAFGSTYVNFGWALTPLPNMIPIDGSTITVWVDGQPVGHPVYNNYRADIAGLFPALANANGAVGYFALDTTVYSDGLHTIAWNVQDNAGNREGIGSRFFTIQNNGGATGGGKTAASRPLEMLERNVVDGVGGRVDRDGLEMIRTRPEKFSIVWIRRGFRADAPPEPIYSDHNGEIRIEMPEVGRIELDLKGEGAEATSWTGALLVGGKNRPLPAGSRLDSANGIFYWQPGPGFVGTYEFVFLKERGTAVRIQIAVENPGFEQTERNDRPRPRGISQTPARF